MAVADTTGNKESEADEIAARREELMDTARALRARGMKIATGEGGARVRDADVENVKIRWCRVCLRSVEVEADLLEDKQLDRLADEVTELRRRQESGEGRVAPPPSLVERFEDHADE